MLKKYKRPLSVIAITLLILFSFWLVVKVGVKKYVETQIKELKFSSFTVSGSPEVKVKLFRRQISIFETEMEGEGAEKIEVHKVQFTGIHIFPILFNGDVIINEILIHEPAISISKQTDFTFGKESSEKIKFRKLEVRNGRLLMRQTDSTKNDTVVYVQLNTELWDLDINSKASEFVFQNHSFNRVRISLNNCKYFFPNALYRVAFDTLDFDSQQPDLPILNFRIKSEYPKYEIAHVKGVETDWYDISLDRIAFNNIQLKSLLKDSLLIVDKTVLHGLEMHAFRDKRLPFPEKPDTKLPMQMINNLPVKVHTDTILINNSYIDYAEHRKDANKAGITKFHAVNASITNLSNIDSLIAGKTKMKASAKVMNQSVLESEFIFPNNRYPEKYNVTGTLQPTKIEAFNPMTVPVASVKVESGQTKTVAFNFYYNNDRSDGDMIFEYENLEVVLLNKKNDSQKDIVSFFANALVVKKNNLQSNKSFNKGTISFERDKKKSIFNYWWKSLLSGIKTSATN